MCKSRKSNIFAIFTSCFGLVLLLAIAVAPALATGGSSVRYPAVPSIPAALLPPPGHAVMKDPSGTYNFTFIGNQQYSTDLATYQRLLEDPYSRIAASKLQIIGSTVLITTPFENTSSSVPNGNDVGWSGAGAGYCSSFSVGGSGTGQYETCNNPTDTLFYSTTSVSSLDWKGHCFNNVQNCITSLWTGMSSASNANLLIQDGIQVCYYELNCSGGGSTSNGHTTWIMWWEIVPQVSHVQIISGYPTSINGSNEQYTVDFYYDNTHPTFLWNVGSWYYSLTVHSNYAQPNFVQSEGIFESPTLFGSAHVQMQTWNPNAPTMTGKYQGVKNYPAYGYIGSSYVSYTTSVYYNGNLEASGVPIGSTTWQDTWFCGPQYC